VFWTCVSLGWVFAGLVVLVAILGLGLRLNRKKSTAHLAMRLAEAYRREGDFETARRLYELAPDLDQNVEQAREGKQRAEQGIREPVLAKPLVEAALRRLLEEREVLADHLEREGIDVELPPIEEADPRREPG
jgi:tetratricopeptide (TPR) repeat protein